MNVINGLTTAPEVIEEMRQMRLDGQDLTSIATAFNCARSTVSRHCKGIPPPGRQRFGNRDRQQLLQNWRPVYQEDA